MVRSLLTLTLAGLVLLTGCATRPSYQAQPLTPHPTYKVGEPYEVDGVWYYPAEDLSYDQTGIASWYGEDFHGKYTANGEVFDLNALTAAHRTLPMPSVVQVTNLENGRVLRLRVNDRGPYARGRIIDVSRRAAQLLGFESPGTAKVRVQILAPESIQVKLLTLHQGGGTQVAESAPALPVAAVSEQALPTPPGVRVAKSDVSLALPPPAQPVPEPPPNYAPPPLPEQVSLTVVRPSGIYIQAGAFAQAENANRLKARLASFGEVRVTGTRVNGANLYRVRIGPVPSVDEADRLLDRIVGSGVTEARIVVD